MRSFKAVFVILLASVAAFATAQPKFSVTYSETPAFKGKFSGRVVVYFGASGSSGEPRFGPNWFKPQPMFSAIFKDVAPGTPMVISDDNAVGYPGPIAKLRAGTYTVQAVCDRGLGGRAIGTCPGNLVSPTSAVTIDPTKDQKIPLVCTFVIPEPVFKDTQNVKEFRVHSKLLSAFYKRPTDIKGAVILPDEWYQSRNAKFPFLYEVPGFGGDYETLSGREIPGTATNQDGVPFVEVYLDPNVPTGHCVFADSANNGPWGDALTTEFIPAVEKKFRGIGAEQARFVGGHSSGGWSSLWLQVAYPDVFGGVWSTSPDPVDFHAFQLVDIYAPEANMFTDAGGRPIPLARQGDTPVIFTKDFSDMERPIRGEQLGSFEAVFSPRGLDGEPEKLWNRDSGVIDPEVARAWMKFDIAYKLKTEWPTLGPKLKGKLHIYCGNLDTFYLDGAVRLLQVEMTGLGSDAKIELVPGDHSTMMTQALRVRISKEMADQYRASYPTAPS